MTFTVGTWNIWVFGDRETARMANLIREHEIDILGIQEAATYFDTEPPRNTAEEIAEELGYDHVFYPAVDFRESDQDRQHILGNAVLSRYPIKEHTSHRLNPDVSFDGTYHTEPRILVDTEMTVDGTSMHFLTTHLQYSHRFQPSEDRQQQAKNMVEVIQELNSPTVLAGDMNASVDSVTVELIENALQRVGGAAPTWTTQPFEHDGWSVDELVYRLDHMFLSQEFRSLSCSRITSDLSDHLPVKATLTVEN